MGWINDGAIIGRGKQMVSFSGEVFCGTLNQWLKRRVAPGNWVAVQVSVVPPQSAIETKEPWNGYIWAWSTNDTLYRSADGINWTADLDLVAMWGTAYLGERSFGGSGDYLYVCHCDAANVVHRFAHRDKLGNWTNNVLPTWPLNPIALCHVTYATKDIVDYGGYVYWSNLGTVNRCAVGGAAWEDVGLPRAGSAHQLIVHDGLLFALGKESFTNILTIYRRTSGGWYLEAEITDFGGTGDDIGYASVGDDGELYVGSGVTTGYVWKRVNGAWVLIGMDTGCTGASNGMVHGGDFFHSENIAWPGGPQMRLFSADFNVSVGGFCPQTMAVDGDGNALYLALIDNATTFPILVKVPLPLVPTAMGAEVFTPGAGTAINVACPAVGQSAVVAGDFGNNEQVEVTEDGAATWTDIDRDVWGAETAAPVLVDPDTVDEVYVALQGLQDLAETDDGGATAWTVRNLAVGYSPGAMARLPDGDELLVGDDGGNQIDYSPNRGERLTNITGAFAGNVAALEVA